MSSFHLSASRSLAVAVRERWLVRGSTDLSASRRASEIFDAEVGAGEGRSSRRQRRSILASDLSEDDPEAPRVSPHHSPMRRRADSIAMVGSGVPVDAIALVIETIDASFTGNKATNASVTRTGRWHDGAFCGACLPFFRAQVEHLLYHYKEQSCWASTSRRCRACSGRPMQFSALFWSENQSMAHSRTSRRSSLAG